MTAIDSPPEFVAAEAWKLLVRPAGSNPPAILTICSEAPQPHDDTAAAASHFPAAIFWEASWSAK